jgi:hypothetical protein
MRENIKSLNLHRLGLGFAALVAALTMVGEARGATRQLEMRFADLVAGTTCPQQAGAATCYSLSGRASAPGFGPIAVGPLIDVEVGQSDPRCGTSASADETLRFIGATLSVRIAGPTLCLGRTGSFARTFTVLGGTGVLVGASGSGSAPITILSQGASESWHGEISAPALKQQAPPTAKIGAVQVARLRGSDQIVVHFSAHVSGWPPLLNYSLSASLANKRVYSSGNFGAGGARTLRLRLPRAPGYVHVLLHVTDSSGNAITVQRAVRAR